MRRVFALIALVLGLSAFGPVAPAFAACSYMSINVEQNLGTWSNWRVIHGNYPSAYANAKSTYSTAGVSVTGCSGYNCPTSSTQWAAANNTWVTAALASPYLIVQSTYYNGGSSGGQVTCRSAI